MLDETLFNLLFAFGLSIVLTYMILASQFESFLHPFTVMLALPLAIVGAVGIIALGSMLNSFGVTNIPGMTINMFFMIGVILLVGLVTKNSILLIDYTNQLRAGGMSTLEALKQACPTRLRPILMTAFTTFGSSLPVVLGLGEGGESRRPMGIAVFGGMISSTFLTLVFIPCIYLVFDSWAARFRKSKS